MRLRILAPLAAVFLAGKLAGAQLIPPPPASEPTPAVSPSIATVPTEGVSVAGSLSVANGRATIGNDGSITAGEQTAHVSLTRGGSLNVCASTRVQLSMDKSTPGGALMVAINRGALEAHYTPGQYSDVILTPDLRILISGPGEANLSLRVMPQGDTCVDNHGAHAPYVLASNLFSGGAYRVQPNQRVLFEHGSLNEVVDNEQEPCGCPPEEPASSGGKGGKQKPAERENPFPLAESEGLKPPPALPSKPVVPAGQTHTEVEAPLAYDAEHPEAAAVVPPAGSTTAAQRPATTAEVPAQPRPHRGFFGSIGHFFRRMFGGR